MAGRAWSGGARFGAVRPGRVRQTHGRLGAARQGLVWYGRRGEVRCGSVGQTHGRRDLVRAGLTGQTHGRQGRVRLGTVRCGRANTWQA